jgi:hypothetical protein
MVPELSGDRTRSRIGVDAAVCLVVKTGLANVVNTGETAVVSNRR